MVEYITYQGKQLPVRISFLAINNSEKDLKKMKKELKAQGDEPTELDYLEPLLYHSLIAGHYAEKRVFDIKRDEVQYILDECLMEFADLAKKFSSKEGAKSANPMQKKSKKG